MQNLQNNILLPKNYLSYSQMTVWMSSKERYRKEYFENGKKLDTKYLRFGKSFASDREYNRPVEKGHFTEYEIKENILGVPILSKLDFYDGNINVFEDDKTGKIPWTQSKVQKHEQLVFYAAALKAKHGKIPKYCLLNWFETKESPKVKSGLINESKISFTGKLIIFRRNFDPREIERMEKMILKVAIEISNAYKDFISEV